MALTKTTSSLTSLLKCSTTKEGSHTTKVRARYILGPDFSYVFRVFLNFTVFKKFQKTGEFHFLFLKVFGSLVKKVFRVEIFGNHRKVRHEFQKIEKILKKTQFVGKLYKHNNNYDYFDRRMKNSCVVFI